MLYLRARYYDSGLRRFISEDPARDGMNWYAYCGNNPLIHWDPSGLDYLALRATAEAEGYIVGWNASTSVASISGNGKYIEYYAGDGKGSFIQDGTMYVWDETYYSDTLLTSYDRAAGVKIAMVNGVPYKDFSVPIDRALYNISLTAEQKGRFNYSWFKGQVDHGAPWDIKRPECWNETIAYNTYPGWGVHIYYFGSLMTPEELGNYSYGFIGAAMGFSMIELITGSWYAAGFPIWGDSMSNELYDHIFIESGFNRYHGR